MPGRGRSSTRIQHLLTLSRLFVSIIVVLNTRIYTTVIKLSTKNFADTQFPYEFFFYLPLIKYIITKINSIIYIAQLNTALTYTIDILLQIFIPHKNNIHSFIELTFIFILQYLFFRMIDNWIKNLNKIAV